MPRGAVLTPAASDELKHRQIAIASAVCSQAPLAGESVIVAATETNERADGLIDMLTKDGFQIERLATGDVSRTVDAVCDRIASSQRLAILLTGQGAAALCLANRRGGVRAAFGSSVESVVEAVRSVGANLLVTDPAVQGAIAWRQMARAFTRGGRRECPAEWRQRLG
jgi:ribose 5-phosphate isomerase RpiB